MAAFLSLAGDDIAQNIYYSDAVNKMRNFIVKYNYVTGSIFNGGPASPPRAPAPPSTSPNDPWQIAQPANMAQIKDLQVQCEKDMMRVRIIFDRPFYGMIFSKGHYRNANCVHVPANLGQTQVLLIHTIKIK